MKDLLRRRSAEEEAVRKVGGVSSDMLGCGSCSGVSNDIVGLVVVLGRPVDGRVLGETPEVVLFASADGEEGLVVNADDDDGRAGVVGNCAFAASKKSLKLSFF